MFAHQELELRNVYGPVRLTNAVDLHSTILDANYTPDLHYLWERRRPGLLLEACTLYGNQTENLKLLLHIKLDRPGAADTIDVQAQIRAVKDSNAFLYTHRTRFFDHILPRNVRFFHAAYPDACLSNFRPLNTATRIPV